MFEKIYLASESLIKKKALFLWASQFELPKDMTLHCIPTDTSHVQPINEQGIKCCKERFNKLPNDGGMRIAIENYIERGKTCMDKCIVILGIGDEVMVGHSDHSFTVAENFLEQALANGKTYGDVVAETKKDVDSSNWMKCLHGIDRTVQIVSAFENAYKKYEIITQIEVIADYPKQGVFFQNVLPLFSNNSFFNKIIDLMVQDLRPFSPQVFVGLESRGFLFSAVANRLNCGFVPIRKAGKLPGDVFSETYEKEYGKDIVEMTNDPILKNKRTIIVDDLIATGGSMVAAINLCDMNKMDIVACSVLRDVPSLRSQYKKIIKKIPVIAHLSFDPEI